MSNVRMFRRDAYLTIRPGTIVAEFSCGTMALDFIERCLDKSFTVTAGDNLTFAVRKRQPESAGDAVPHIPTPPVGEGRRFAMQALTPKGERLPPEIARMLGRFELPHGDGL
jgi:hypothetical protein